MDRSEIQMDTTSQEDDTSYFSRVYNSDEIDTNDASLLPTEAEIEAEMARLFPFIPPTVPVYEPPADRDPEAETSREELEYLISQLGSGTAMQRMRRMDDCLTDVSHGVHKASKMMDTMLDELSGHMKAYNNACRSNAYQNVVLKTVEIDADGVLRTVNASKHNDHEAASVDEEHGAESTEGMPKSELCHTNGVSSSSAVKVQGTEKADEDDDGIEAIEQVKKLDAISEMAPTPRILPRMVPAVGKKVYAMRGSSLNCWDPALVLKVDRNSKSGQLEFHIQFDSANNTTTTGGRTKAQNIRVMDAKHLAFSIKTPFILPVGARVIARFTDELKRHKSASEFYAGIVAERPIPHNANRYLIFFDDGYAQYVTFNNVLWVCESSKDVWNDVHPNSQAFIKEYLKVYPERPMVRLSKGTIVSTEWNGNWWIGRVVEVDCSLVKIFFEADNRYEWIYRGSKRLAPLYNKQKRQEARGSNEQATTGSRRRNDINARIHPQEAKIEYVNDGPPSPPAPAKTVQTARKSTAAPPPKPTWSHGISASSNFGRKPMGPISSTGLLEYEGRMNRINIPKKVEPPQLFVPHICKSTCVRPYKENDPDVKTINPLALPMFYGFEREVGKNPRRSIFYRAPCGRRLRDAEEMHEFLLQAKYNMGIDHFCFDYQVDCFNEFVPASTHFIISDITYGKERAPVQCCNSIDHDYPDYLDYSKDRQPTDDVHMNLDTDFLVCCDCTDDCADRSKCACWQLTMEGLNKHGDEELSNLEVGYQHRRLLDHCVTGIYECNRTCKCKKTCLNRVVQHDMKWQLQIFKTSNKGWAIRSLHDIPQGAFICVYAGQLLTDHGANEGGKAFGDEYLAELDYIEVCEGYKEGFEAEVVEPEADTRRGSKSEADKDYEGDDFDLNVNSSSYSLRMSKATEEESRKPKRQERKSVRSFFGSDEMCYIMDAKSSGNIGRYLNHSCQPNVFVQNVFVDTHDLRFPWVAFFAFKHIRAGTELTWDYNYDIGSVPGKTMYCYCGTPECRGRLL